MPSIIPTKRGRVQLVYFFIFYMVPSLRKPKVNVQQGHFLRTDIAAFDAPFFSITAAEAACMDPQQRGLLESVYRALENGKTPR
jgi:acyl transferase domain-containing protein